MLTRVAPLQVGTGLCLFTDHEDPTLLLLLQRISQQIQDLKTEGLLKEAPDVPAQVALKWKL